MSRATYTIALATSAGALAVGAAIGLAPYAAADPAASPSSSASSATSPGAAASSGSVDPRRGPGGHSGGFLRGTAVSDLAETLGVDAAKLQTALEEIRVERSSTTRQDTPDRAAREAALVSALAEKLGLDEEKVEQAFEDLEAERDSARAAALQETLGAAVQAGTLTQAEADAVTKAVRNDVIDVHAHH